MSEVEIQTTFRTGKAPLRELMAWLERRPERGRGGIWSEPDRDGMVTAVFWQNGITGKRLLVYIYGADHDGTQT